MSREKKDASDTEALLNMRRAYTTGGKLGARQMFTFNEDGTISGLKKVEPVTIAKSPTSRKSADLSQKKFGKISSAMSVSAMSVAESKVAFSDANYMPQEGQAEGAHIGKMQGKPGVTIWNLLLVPGTLFFSLLTGADILQSSTQILDNEDYFPGLSDDKASSVTANSLTYGQAVAVFFVLVIGFMFDTLGRRITASATFLLGAISTFFIPIVAPSIIGYDLMRVIFIQTCVVMLSNPFINDYVTVQSRGIATGFQMVGLTVGNLLSVAGLYTFTNMFDNKIWSYSFLALLQVVWAVLVWFMISEVEVRDEKEQRHNEKKTFCGKLYSMLKQTYKACQQDHALLISLIGLIPSRNTANLQQSNFYIWIKALVPDKDVATSTWRNQNIISNICGLPMVFIVGRLSDKVSPKILVPAVLSFQVVIMIGYMFCKDPTNWYAYLLSAFQGGSGYAIIVAMQGYAVKRVPKMIRGIIMALIISLSGLGGIAYLQISSLFFTSNPNYVFGVLGIFDALVLIFIVAMILMGKYGDAAPQEDTFGEGNSQKNEKDTADFQKDHEYDDDIPDVPLYKDIYEEQIPEMSSDREASSFHTKKLLHKSGRSGRVFSESVTEEEQEFVGSIRQTDTNVRGSYNAPYNKGSEVSKSKMKKVQPGQQSHDNFNSHISMHDSNMMTLRSIEEEGGKPSEAAKRSTVNRSDSDDEQLLTADRATHVPKSKNQVEPTQQSQRSRLRQTAVPRRRKKRSNSVEESARPTIIQELLQNHIVEEDKSKEESD